ncbi:hypothetical protein CEP54_012192 [Fusarium duplospermum]|uniref:Lysine-specific metallo-endopeptidase domain-containing protein n=1 Tax=Fusarium duplospermum TaxID=1325734 RepID=A0A428PA60_9HYPO|nr:hypothetical protein CEP54_012192 [Fusarium duplospermum]
MSSTVAEILKTIPYTRSNTASLSAKMMLKKLFFFFGLLQAVISQERRIYIDTVSCAEGKTFDAVQEAYQSAIIRAGLVIEALRPWAEEGANINTFDGRIRNVFDLLFGAEWTRTKVGYVFDHLDRLLELQYMNNLMSNGDWVAARTMNDIEIRCNGDHIIPHKHPQEPNINYQNSITGKWLADNDDELSLLSRWAPAIAVTSQMKTRDWDPRAPEIVAYNQWKLSYTINWDGFPGNDLVTGGIKIDQAAVEAAANPRLHRWFVTQIPSWVPRISFAPIDLLDRLESTMLHELTHTIAGRRTVDLDWPNSYGWRNCLRIQSHKNADSIALFALAVELINHYQYDVNEAGELIRIE